MQQPDPMPCHRPGLRAHLATYAVQAFSRGLAPGCCCRAFRRGAAEAQSPCWIRSCPKASCYHVLLVCADATPISRQLETMLCSLGEHAFHESSTDKHAGRVASPGEGGGRGCAAVPAPALVEPRPSAPARLPALLDSQHARSMHCVSLLLMDGNTHDLKPKCFTLNPRPGAGASVAGQLTRPWAPAWADTGPAYSRARSRRSARCSHAEQHLARLG